MSNIIFLVDMNAFYISCETTRNSELACHPSAVAGDPKNRTGIILAANYKARSMGVKTAMSVYQAKQLCPQIKLVPPDHNFYKIKSNQVMRLLRSYTPLVEENSIDEAWLDMTGSIKLFGTPEETAQKIMDHIESELGLWCSVGISENKFLAKMAAEMKKPKGITQLWQRDIKDKMWPMKVDKLYGIGAKTAEKLNREGIFTIGDLAGADHKILLKKFGKSGLEIYNHSHGIDQSQVTAHDHNDVKSIGKSVTLSNNLSDLTKAKSILLSLSDQVGTRARKLEKKGRTVQITIKYSDFKTITRQQTLEATSVTKTIYNTAVNLLERNWESNRLIRLLGVTLGDFNHECQESQISIFDALYTSEIPKDHSNERDLTLEHTIDLIRKKFGHDSLKPAVLVRANNEKQYIK
ncbi:DNA polymerase IV [Alkalibacter mobilis]|uniref:DNA polymerase IV n=1 Tax=Alkalibacter mobilis TaxID=2787712 RepID=UPI00189DFB9E|nr:DNA polymerase IV [Alkalibacter mobilis]MBF7095949.1 DNA polymerase IV [Alkalibacter mobilis]